MADHGGMEQRQQEEQAEESTEATAAGITRDLKQEFLGLRKVEHWPESDFVTVETALQQGNIGEIEKTKLYQQRERIRNETLGTEQVNAILKLQDALKADPQLVALLSQGLYTFQRERLADLHVSKSLIDEAIAHEQAVEGLIDDDQPVAKLIATVHDISKYTAREVGMNQDQKVYENNKPHLGLHETASAVLAGDVLKTALSVDQVKTRLMSNLGISAAEWPSMVAAWKTIAEIAVAGHGYREFPDKMAAAVPGQESKGIKKLFGTQLYLENYRQMHEIVDGNVDVASVSQLEQIIEGVREADMMVGMDPASYMKYHSEAKPDDMLRKKTSYDYILGYASSFAEYFYKGEAPDVLGLRDKMKDARNKGALLFGVLKAVQDGGQEAERAKALCRAAFGIPAGEGMLKAAEDMKKIFDDAQQGKEVPGFDKAAFHDTHQQAFANILTEIFTANTADFETASAQSIIGPMYDELKRVYPPRTPQE